MIEIAQGVNYLYFMLFLCDLNYRHVSWRDGDSSQSQTSDQTGISRLVLVL